MRAATIESSPAPVNTRRWPRYQAHLPVLISVKSEVSALAVPGLASEISQSGMALYGGVPVQPGDVMEIQFQTPGKPRVAGVVRNRSGYCFGLKFLSPMSSGDVMANVLQSGGAGAEAVLPLACVADAPNATWSAWLTEHRGDFSIAIATTLLLLALIGWGSRQQNFAPVQAPAEPSLTVGERILVYFGLADVPTVPKEMGNPKAQVWVDRHTALYYCEGADLYGKTPDGQLTTQRDAQLDEFEPAAGNYCR